MDRLKFRVWSFADARYLGRINYATFNEFWLNSNGKLTVSEVRQHESSQEVLWQDVCVDDSEYLIEQCTGLKDKNGNLIYEGDVLRIKRLVGDSYTMISDCLYSVKNDKLGFSCSFCGYTNEDDDNQYPLNPTLSSSYNNIDWYDDTKIYAKNTYWDNYHLRSSGISSHETKDIEIIGNIHENKELLND